MVLRILFLINHLIFKFDYFLAIIKFRWFINKSCEIMLPLIVCLNLLCLERTDKLSTATNHLLVETAHRLEAPLQLAQRQKLRTLLGSHDFDNFPNLVVSLAITLVIELRFECLWSIMYELFILT